ncbi:MAG: D-glycero-beta-D-manno-heptose 1-phosphate adenylyltransferase [bacterium]|jgi:D-glycero-beta-D-manno-heptose 1-phosphate adenylyltransferase
MEYLEIIKAKIFDWETLPNILAVWRFQNKKVVFTNGCFDILHLGHIDYLSKARGLGDILVVGVNTDESVNRLKGNNRPITGETSRSLIMASLHFVDAVILFDQDTPYDLIKLVQPDILAKGKDYKAEEVVGYDIVTRKGGEVITLDLLEGFSTSAIEQKIRTSQ